MDNKYRKILRFILVITCFLEFTILFSQKNDKIILKKISKNSFISSTPDDNRDLNLYSCVNCSLNIEYIRNRANNNYHDSFKINRKEYRINELLDEQKMEFYNVTYNNRKYLLIASSDFGSSKFSYMYKHYYLFTFSKTGQILTFKRLINCKLNENNAFLNLINPEKRSIYK